MIEVSEEMVREAYAEDGEDSVVLITIEADGMPAALLATDHPEGVYSRGQQFLYFPFKFTFGGAGADEPARAAKIEIGNVDGQIAAAIRIATGEPAVTVEVVRPSAPDLVERAVLGATLGDVEVDGAVVTGTLKSLDLAGEPACCASYIIARTPGLF